MMHKHHRKRRSQGGADHPPNVIEIPDWLHNWIHENPEWAYENGWLVKSHLDPADVRIRLPEEIVAARKAKAKKDPEKPRQKATVTINVPKDSRENGAEVLQTLIDECRKELTEPMGWNDDVPAYFVVTAVMADWLAGHEA